ncbi:MAG: hypothetical protein F7B17_06630 [Desulfurococcales archaeon]|nr:hypothetical protein [Desulfurococcales archaeon]
MLDKPVEVVIVIRGGSVKLIVEGREEPLERLTELLPLYVYNASRDDSGTLVLRAKARYSWQESQGRMQAVAWANREPPSLLQTPQCLPQHYPYIIHPYPIGDDLYYQPLFGWLHRPCKCRHYLILA